MSFFSGLLGLAGGLLGRKFARDDQERDWDRQQFMASNSIQMRAEDAKKAGIHPVFALGAQPVSYAPSMVGGSDFSSSFANMGSSLDDVMNKRSSRGMTSALDALSLERAGLENELLRSQIRRSNAPGLPPSSPVGGGDSDILLPVINKKLKFSDPMFGQKIENAWGEGPPQWIASIFQAAKDIDKNVTLDDVWNALKPRLTVRKVVRAAAGGFPRFGGRR